MKFFLLAMMVFFFFACDNKIVNKTCDNKDCKTLGQQICNNGNLSMCLIGKEGCLEKKPIKTCTHGCNVENNECNECTKKGDCGSDATCDDNKCVCKNGNYQYNDGACSCEAGFHDNGGTCVSNTKTETCSEDDIPTENTNITKGKVEVTWNAKNNEWNKTPQCDWKCNEKFHKEKEKEGEKDICVSNTKKVACSKKDIKHANSIMMQVDLTWDVENNKWSEPPQCKWECNEGWKKNGDATGCTDIDECTTTKTHNCDSDANEKCNNTPGGYECVCETGYYDSDPNNNNAACKKIISCKVTPDKNDDNFNGRIYLEITGNNLSDTDYKKDTIKLSFLAPGDSDSSSQYSEKVKIENDDASGIHKFYFDIGLIDQYYSLFNVTGEYKYHVEFEDSNDITLECDTDGSDNDPNSTGSKKSYSDDKRGRIKIDCTDNTCSGGVCVYGTCEPEAPDNCSEVEFRGHTYKFCKNQKTWTEAQTACNGNYHLVKIENARENEWIKKNIENKGVFWIGLKWQGSNNSGIGTGIDQNWKWEDGSSELDPSLGGYNNWASKQPNNSSHDCVGIGKNNLDGWSDLECSRNSNRHYGPLYYICEKDQ